MKKLESKEDFVTIACDNDGRTPVVKLEDGRMGMCNHWNEDGVLVDAYRGNDHECLLIPFSSFYDLGVVLFAGLKHAQPQD